MNNSDYHKILSVSSHWLKNFLDNGPADCYRQHLAPQPPSTESPSTPLRMGTLVHCLLLTPQWFSSEFLVTEYERRSSAGKARYNQLMATELTLIKPAELERAQTMVAALKAHPDARKLLHGGKKERVIIQPRPSGLLPLKARLDVHREAQRQVIELKTIYSLHTLDMAIDRYRYLLSAAFYQHLVKALSVVFIFVQSAEPHDVMVLELSPQQLQSGSAQWRTALAQFDECWLNNHWPEPDRVILDRIHPLIHSPRFNLPLGELAL